MSRLCSGVAKLFLGHKLVQFEWLTHSLTLSPHTTFCIPFRRDLWRYVVRLWRFQSGITKVERFQNKSFSKGTSIFDVRCLLAIFDIVGPTYNVRQFYPITSNIWGLFWTPPHVPSSKLHEAYQFQTQSSGKLFWLLNVQLFQKLGLKLVCQNCTLL